MITHKNSINIIRKKGLHKSNKNSNSKISRKTIKVRFKLNSNKQHNKLYNNDLIKVVRKLFDCNKYDDAIVILKEFYKNIQITDEKMNKLNRSIIPFGVKGNSGSKIGILNYNKNHVIKIFNGKNSSESVITKYKCIKISNHFNEIFINYLINNLDKIIKVPEHKYNNIKQHILPLLDYGITNTTSFIIIPLIGIKNNINDNIITNFRELLNLNHSIYLKKAYLENKIDIIQEYDKFISKKLNDYIETIKFLQTYLNYINSDVKLTNIFINKIDEKNKLLSEWGFITNFNLIISDLEKSSISINNLKITTIPKSPLKIKIAHLFNKGLIYNIRYKCNNTIEKYCDKPITIFDIDILTLIIDYYSFMIKINNNYITIMQHVYKIFINYIDTHVLNTLQLILEHGKYNINKYYSLIIGNILQHLCANIKKIKK